MADDQNVPEPFDDDFGLEGFLDASENTEIQQFIDDEVSVNSPFDYNNYLGPT